MRLAEYSQAAAGMLPSKANTAGTAISDDRDHHDGIAEIDAERDDGRQISMGCRQEAAHQGEREADDLQPGDFHPEQNEVEQEDQHRNERLLDGDVNGTRIVDGGVERRVESDVADQAEKGEKRQVFPDHRPVAAQIGNGDRENDAGREDPSPEGEKHRADVTNGKFARHRIAAPAQRRDDQEQIGFAVHDDFLRVPYRRPVHVSSSIVVASLGWDGCRGLSVGNCKLSRKNHPTFTNRSLSSGQGIIDARVCRGGSGAVSDERPCGRELYLALAAPLP
jgi:hypothetical protein